MGSQWTGRAATLGPVVVSAALILTACGSSEKSTSVAQPGISAESAPNEPAAAPKADRPAASAPDPAPKVKSQGGRAAEASATTGKASKIGRTTAAAQPPGSTTGRQGKVAPERSISSIADQRIYEQKNGATDTGVTKDSIKLGSINMHGMALGNLFIRQNVYGLSAAMASINDRGGVLGRRLSLKDCDDGPGEVSRSKACIKKLVVQDRIFALLGGATWASASVHDDLKQHRLPYLGSWAYSQTEWQDPYMFPTHMSMIHEAMAGANWVKNVIKPQKYGLICLTSPEMQLACKEVQNILDQSGAKLVKKVDVSISETSMSSQVLAMRAAAPDHIVHYVINPATMAKFMVESAQQNYYPPKGLSGNHLAAEVLGSIFGKHPTNRYWTNTTYRLWGPEFMATMNKYARANRGTNHHIVQAGYVGANVFVQAAKAIGPNLTRERLMAQMGNGDVYASDASLDQRFSWQQSERTGNNWNKQWGQGREFMYRYTSTNTVSNPDGTPNGFEPDKDQFVIYTWR